MNSKKGREKKYFKTFDDQIEVKAALILPKKNRIRFVMDKFHINCSDHRGLLEV